MPLSQIIKPQKQYNEGNPPEIPSALDDIFGSDSLFSPENDDFMSNAAMPASSDNASPTVSTDSKTVDTPEPADIKKPTKQKKQKGQKKPTNKQETPEIPAEPTTPVPDAAESTPTPEDPVQEKPSDIQDVPDENSTAVPPTDEHPGESVPSELNEPPTVTIQEPPTEIQEPSVEPNETATEQPAETDSTSENTIKIADRPATTASSKPIVNPEQPVKHVPPKETIAEKPIIKEEESDDNTVSDDVLSDIDDDDDIATQISTTAEMTIRQYASTDDQAAEAIDTANAQLASGELSPAEMYALTHGASSALDAYVYNLLSGIGDGSHYERYSSSLSGPSQVARGLKVRKLSDRRLQGQILVPHSIRTKEDSSIWNKTVINDFGYPFINFTSAGFKNILSKDENISSDAIKEFKSSLKAQKSSMGKSFSWIWDTVASNPKEVLAGFKSKKGANYNLRQLYVSSDEFVEADQMEDDSIVTCEAIKADGVNRYKPLSLRMAFIRAFYNAVDPNKSYRTYMKAGGYSTKEEYIDSIAMNDSHPEFYILQSDTGTFQVTDAPDTLFRMFMRIFSDSVAKVSFVRVSINGHQGGMLMPTNHANILFGQG